MTRISQTSSDVDARVMSILRSQTPDQSIRIAAGLHDAARNLVRDMIRHEHPTWGEDEIRRETIRRMHGI